MMKEIEYINKSLLEIPCTAKEILNFAEPTKIITLEGELGAGKTTLIREFCKILNVKEPVTSPTFTIVNQYTGTEKVFHLDFYRIKNLNEVYDLGYEEILFSGHYCFIEWPSKLKSLLPANLIEIDISFNENLTRNYKIISK